MAFVQRAGRSARHAAKSRSMNAEGPIMPVSDEFIGYMLDQFSQWCRVTARRMFGGAGLYCEGTMFGLIADDVPYLKVDDSNREQYLEAGSSPFKPYPDRPTTMSYFEIPPEILDDTEELVKWAEQSLAIQKRKKGL